MKPFEYYEEAQGVEYYSFIWERNEIKRRVQLLDTIPLTVNDRELRANQIAIEVAAEAKELNKPFLEAHAALKAEFWADLRADLRYTDLFNDEGVKRFESWVHSEVSNSKLDPNDDCIPTKSEEMYDVANWLLNEYKTLRNLEKSVQEVSDK